jgi:hypothetical protein
VGEHEEERAIGVRQSWLDLVTLLNYRIDPTGQFS